MPEPKRGAEGAGDHARSHDDNHGQEYFLIPAAAAYGEAGLISAGLLGMLVGILPSRWLSRRIYEGIKETGVG